MSAEGLKSCAVESCRLCRSSDISLLFKQVQDYISGELFDVRRCNRCGVAFTHPQPVSIHRFYPPYYRRYGALVHSILGFLYRLRARSWVHTLGSSGMALEIGCGDGWMLRALREQGWKVVGNERTVQSTIFAARVNGLPVFVGGLEALKSEARFDLIILFQVLEHLADPLGTLQECVRLLRPGGALVVAVPNIESWQARVSGPSWFHLDVPRHLFHFSPLSLSYALERAGLDVAAIHFVSLEHDPYGWVQSVLNRAGLPQNLLTRLLMGGSKPGAAISPAGIGIGFLSACLLGPALLLTLCSWIARSGALMELRAKKRIAHVSLHGPTDVREPSKQADQSFYEDIWVAWKDMQRFAPAPRYLRRMVMKELLRLEFRSVLDVGCGDGTLLKLIADAYPHVALSGTELSETALKSCRELLPQASLFNFDIERDDVPSLASDLVMSVQVLEHLKDDLAALRKLRSMCRRYVLINVPGGKLDEHGRRLGHYRHYTKKGLAYKMEHAGFRVIRVFACGWPMQSLFYRQLVRRLPRRTVERVGLGGYSWKKRKFMQLADWAYRFNLSFVGTEIFAIGVPAKDEKL